MQTIRKYNAAAYQQTRWHYAADTESSRTICGKDIAEIKGSQRRWKVQRKDADGMSEYEICGTCRNKLKGASSIKLSKADMKALLARAGEAGDKAFREAIPTPMVVYTPKNVMGSLLGGDDGGADPTQPIYQVNEGVCGSGWVKIRPGSSRFARWLIKEGYGHSDSYAGGVNLRLWNVCGSRYSQSLTRWEAAARAVAEVLRDAGITAYAESRID